MTTYLLIRRNDGGVSIQYRPNRDMAQAEMAVSKWLAAHPTHSVLSWSLVDDPAFPPDRQFRNAWGSDGAAVIVDMPKARNIHRDRIRAARANAFIGLDAEWMKAVGQKTNPEADAIEAKRQALRDAPSDPRIEAATTPAELAAVWPTDLPR